MSWEYVDSSHEEQMTIVLLHLLHLLSDVENLAEHITVTKTMSLQWVSGRPALCQNTYNTDRLDNSGVTLTRSRAVTFSASFIQPFITRVKYSILLPFMFPLCVAWTRGKRKIKNAKEKATSVRLFTLALKKYSSHAIRAFVIVARLLCNKRLHWSRGDRIYSSPAELQDCLSLAGPWSWWVGSVLSLHQWDRAKPGEKVSQHSTGLNEKLTETVSFSIAFAQKPNPFVWNSCTWILQLLRSSVWT